jgi:hypothetical protein
MAVAAVFIHDRENVPADRWRLPLWPLWVVLSFVTLTLAASQQAAGPLRFVGIIAAIALVYYFAFLRPRRKAHFIMDLVPRQIPHLRPSPSRASSG